MVSTPTQANGPTKSPTHKGVPSISDIRPNCLLARDIPKKPKGSDNEYEYTRTLLLYNFGTPERPDNRDAIFSLGVKNVTIRRKVYDKSKREKGTPTWKANIFLNQEDTKYLDILNSDVIQVINRFKDYYQLDSFDPTRPGKLRLSYFYQTDTYGKTIPGTSPIISLRIDDRSLIRQVRIDKDGKKVHVPVSHEALKDKLLTGFVIFRVANLYHSMAGPGGGLPSLTLYLKSLIFDSVSDIDNDILEDDNYNEWLNSLDNIQPLEDKILTVDDNILNILPAKASLETSPNNIVHSEKKPVQITQEIPDPRIVANQVPQYNFNKPAIPNIALDTYSSN
jgi:hypothetical protein